MTQRKGGVIKQTAIWTTTSQSPCHITLSHTLHSALHSVQRCNLATGETFGQWMGYENAGVGRLARDKARFGRSTHTTNLPTLLLKLSQLTCWWTLDGARLTSAYFHVTHLTPLTHSAQILMLTLLQFGRGIWKHCKTINTPFDRAVHAHLCSRQPLSKIQPLMVTPDLREPLTCILKSQKQKRNSLSKAANT